MAHTIRSVSTDQHPNRPIRLVESPVRHVILGNINRAFARWHSVPVTEPINANGVAQPFGGLVFVHLLWGYGITSQKRMRTDRPSGEPVNSQDRHCVRGFGVVEQLVLCLNQSDANNKQYNGNTFHRSSPVIMRRMVGSSKPPIYPSSPAQRQVQAGAPESEHGGGSHGPVCDVQPGDLPEVRVAPREVQLRQMVPAGSPSSVRMRRSPVTWRRSLPNTAQGAAWNTNFAPS